MKAVQIAAIAAVTVGALFLVRKANATTTAATSVGGAGGAAPGSPASPYGTSGVNGGYSLGSTLGASSAGPNVAAGTARTGATTSAAPSANEPAPQPPGGGYAYVYPEQNTVTQAAQGAYIKPEWAADIKTIYQQGGAEALNAAQEKYGIATFNAGQARAIYDLSDADVAYLQGQGILQ